MKNCTIEATSLLDVTAITLTHTGAEKDVAITVHLKPPELRRLIAGLKRIEQKMPPPRRRLPGVIKTAAGPMCSKCGRGRNCWLGPDESPCQCKLVSHA